ncbi:efflux RND transporter periplasmic adaptor subunit [Saccharospirillum alexandrii]|uniref:efflux RND transporter periplasmic adaptor subunit n=1 Tax=Saccharospirillum alexandrii TaxID=2448477 RepID=UPI000FDA3C92|nr:efflux RND transporter periplasmic adaptor subunit [Saccharospirillum alexandrii]
MTSDTPSNAKPDWAMSKRELMNAERQRQGLAPQKRRRWPWLLALIVIGVALLVFAMQASPEPAETGPAEPEDTEPVLQISATETSTLAPQRLEQRLRVTGTLSPVEKAQLSSQVNAPVLRIAVRPGDTVEEGDVLVEMDATDLTNQLNQLTNTARATQAQLTLAQNSLDRGVRLAEQGLSPASSIEELRANVEAQSASLATQEWQIRAAERAVANAVVRAPFSGQVSARSVEPGQYVSVGTPLVTLVDLTALEMQANLPVNAATLVKAGQAVTIEVDSAEPFSLQGTVDRINPVALDATRTLPVYIRVTEPDARLRGGMFATGYIVINARDNALSVPSESVRSDAEGDFVLLLEDDHLVRQPVTVAGEWESGTRLEIAEGLAIGDTLVSAPLPELRAGDRIAIAGGN